MAKAKPIKVCLTNEGFDTETPWAEDLGPAPGPKGSRRVRLINVPFMHAKPTWGDVIVVTPTKGGFPTWDRDNTPWPEIGTRIAEDGGRWAMIVDYAPHPDTADAFTALAHACAEHEVVCEGAWGPGDGAPGRAYLALKNELTDRALMAALRAASLPCELIQIHPAPEPAAKREATGPASQSRVAAKTATNKPPMKNTAMKKRMAKKTATKTATKTAAKTPAAKKPAAKKRR